jgi:hypothetical protein
LLARCSASPARGAARACLRGEVARWGWSSLAFSHRSGSSRSHMNESLSVARQLLVEGLFAAGPRELDHGRSCDPRWFARPIRKPGLGLSAFHLRP